MIINAALAWWNERPEDLKACVAGIANVADRIIAVDGAYSRYPGATIKSPKEQHEALIQAAREFDLDLITPSIDRLWAGQVEKRNFMMREASVDCDWIMVVDTDHIIKTVRDEARVEIEQITLNHDVDVIDAHLFTPLNETVPIETSAAGKWHEESSSKILNIAHFHRPYPEFTVDRFHYWYSAVKNGEKIWMWYGDGSARDARHVGLETQYQIIHRTLFRSPEQVLASRGFLNDRAWVVRETGQEDDRPDLPRPVYDYTTMPI